MWKTLWDIAAMPWGKEKVFNDASIVVGDDDESDVEVVREVHPYLRCECSQWASRGWQCPRPQRIECSLGVSLRLFGVENRAIVINCRKAFSFGQNAAHCTVCVRNSSPFTQRELEEVIELRTKWFQARGENPVGGTVRCVALMDRIGYKGGLIYTVEEGCELDEIVKFFRREICFDWEPGTMYLPTHVTTQSCEGHPST